MPRKGDDGLGLGWGIFYWPIHEVPSYQRLNQYSDARVIVQFFSGEFDCSLVGCCIGWYSWSIRLDLRLGWLMEAN